mmetsp:Transcript_103959/g.232256  ORF Transcript_103959/g.232256 Transcript_103959/m.232256 type:complete len:217 (-) Transcript_103959:73-723(-)
MAHSLQLPSGAVLPLSHYHSVGPQPEGTTDHHPKTGGRQGHPCEVMCNENVLIPRLQGGVEAPVRNGQAPERVAEQNRAQNEQVPSGASHVVRHVRGLQLGVREAEKQTEVTRLLALYHETLEPRAKIRELLFGVLGLVGLLRVQVIDHGIELLLDDLRLLKLFTGVNYHRFFLRRLHNSLFVAGAFEVGFEVSEVDPAVPAGDLVHDLLNRLSIR